jgi:hypothetical protein
MATTEKCLHPACDCVVSKGGPFGRYCSEHCREAGQITALRCHCHHPECGQTVPATAGEKGVSRPVM